MAQKFQSLSVYQRRGSLLDLKFILKEPALAEIETSNIEKWMKSQRLQKEIKSHKLNIIKSRQIIETYQDLIK